MIKNYVKTGMNAEQVRKLSNFTTTKLATKFWMGLPLYIYLILSPFYFFRSGLPQIADLSLVLGALMIVFYFGRFSIILNGFTKTGLMFVSDVAVVNLLTSLYLQKYEPLLPILYYLYNFSVVLFILYLYQEIGDKILEFTFKFAMFSVLLQFFLIIIKGDFLSSREVGFFNNPNQLGYYSLTTLGIISITFKRTKASFLTFFAAFVACLLLAFLSLSKSAIIAILIVAIPFVLPFLRKYRRRRKLAGSRKFLILALFVLLLLIALLNWSKISDFILIVSKNLQLRFSTLGKQSDDSLVGRGYSRIINYPGFIFFGAGEGLTARKDPRYDDLFFQGEIHSSFGTLIFSYGIPGLTLFLIFVLKVIDLKDINIVTSIAAVSLYGLVHQGLRFTQFWILLAISYIAKNAREQE